MTLTLLLRLQPSMSKYEHQTIFERIEKGEVLFNPQHTIRSKTDPFNS